MSKLVSDRTQDRAKQYGKRALVLGFDTRAFLAVVRSLGRRGVEVHTAWHDEMSPAVRSKYILVRHALPHYSDGLNWKAPLIDLLQSCRFDLVLPCHDQTLLPLYAHRHDIEPYARVCLPAPGVLPILFDKSRTVALAKSLGISAPVEFNLFSEADLKKALAFLEFPVVLKPHASFGEDNPTTKRRVSIVHSQADLQRSFTELRRFGAVIAQEYVSGVGVGVELLMHRGKKLLAFQHRRVHESEAFGGSYRVSEPLSPHLLAAACRLLEEVKYTGVAMVEFRVNQTTGQWWLLEVNARFWGSLPLAVAAGADFPYALFDMMVNGTQAFPQHYRTGVYCRNYTIDLDWQIENWRLDNKGDETQRPWAIVRQALVNLVLFREHSDTLVVDDVYPGLVEVWAIAKAKAAGLRTKSEAWFLNRSLGRLLLRQRLTWALRNRPRVVMFLCKGNICRSPFAAALARTIFGNNVDVVSRGYLGPADRTPPAVAVNTARRFGLDISTHRSTLVTSDDIQGADLVFVFDYSNYHELRHRFPAFRSRLHFLRALQTDGDVFVADPYGMSEKGFQACYEVIGSAVNTLRVGVSQGGAVQSCR